MVHERDLIPFEASSLLGERLLVLAPHPDDEVIGCGGVVAHHLRGGRSVLVVVATDGIAAVEGADDSYVSQREEESRRALSTLGDGAEVEFLRHRDRQLSDADLTETLAATLREFRPDLLLVPSPVELHPDHLALSRQFCNLVQRDPALFSELALARVAFYEVSPPLRPNTLVDITDVAEAKYAAIDLHQSQTEIRDYAAFARGLNAYRAMTLDRAVRYVEAYYVIDLPRLHTLPFTAVQSEVGDARRAVEVQRERLPITVVIRTRDRPHLLREAVESVRATQYPAKIVVVNDGGAPPPLTDVELVEHQPSRGRSEAMNSGVRAAQTEYIAFLDDDDLFYPEHLETLARAATTGQRAAWYTDAVSAFLSVGPKGSYETSSRQRLFGGAFDRDLLLVDNYIPLPTLLVRRSDFLDLGGFDPAFDLLEDWDFLIRLSVKGDFLHVPAVTCEIRHFRDGDSAILQNPEGSERFREAKKQLWRKHSTIMNADVFANAFESQKRARRMSDEELIELRGVRHHLQTDLARLEREKQSLIAEIQSLHGSVTTHALRVRELEGGAAAMSDAIRRLEAEVVEGVELRRQHAEMKRSVEETQTTIEALYGEIHRLQGLLDMIYRSRTWKLHTVVERMRGHR